MKPAAAAAAAAADEGCGIASDTGRRWECTHKKKSESLITFYHAFVMIADYNRHLRQRLGLRMVEFLYEVGFRKDLFGKQALHPGRTYVRIGPMLRNIAILKR